jgi:uncharacterized protein YkwD
MAMGRAVGTMSHTSFFRATAKGTLAGAALLLVGAGAATIQPVAAGPPAASAAYVAIQPCRLTDTRAGTGFTQIDQHTLQVATKGICGIPAGATALALTLTVVDPQANGYLAAWPANQAQPTASSLNFSAHQVRANGSIIRVDTNGAFRVFTSVSAQVVVDVVGAFVPASSARAGRFMPMAPTRMYDSRPSGKKFGGGASFTLGLPSGVPADAVAVAVNVTVTESMGAGFVTEFPAGGQRPMSSILNVDAANQTRAVAGILPVSSQGMSLYVSSGGYVIVDILGYFTGPSASQGSDGLFTAYDPQRLLDTRGASPLGNGVPVFPNGGLELATSQGGSLAYNITSVNGDAGYVTAYPAGNAVPATSTVNSVGGGDVVANFSITQVSNRGLGLYSQSRSHLLVDLQGWFSGPSATATLPPPANVDPGPAPASPSPNGPTFSACAPSGLDILNAKRAASGVGALGVSPGAEGYACAWALHLAQVYNPSSPGSALVHSSDTARDSAAGCGAGENIAFISGTNPVDLFNLWFHSAPHLANILDAEYRNVGIGIVMRTELNGSQTIWGVTDLTLC